MKKILNYLSIDYHIGITLLLRLWSILAGAIIILLIPIYLPPEEQGYYFTFASLIAMQVFFELGFNYVIVQLVGHEMAHVSINKYRVLDGNKRNIYRLYSLTPLLKKWYSIIAFLFFVIVFLIGFFFFSINGSLTIESWLPAWFLLVLFSSINLLVSPFLALLEGMGFIGQVATIRLIQSVTGYVVLTIMFVSGAELLSITAISGTAAIFSVLCIYCQYRKLIFTKPEGFYSCNDSIISWRKEIFPFQWKIAISWLSGYFMFQLFNPMIFAHQGPIEAGKIGLSLAIFSAMQSLSMSWVSAKSPVMARLIANNNRMELNQLFMSLLRNSALLNIFISISFLLFIHFIQNYEFGFLNRMASFNILILLLFISVINHVTVSMAIYMRAHKEEPMLWNSIVVGGLNLIFVYFFSKISSFATIASYGAVMMFVCFPWCLYLFKNYYNGKCSRFNQSQ